ncbi:MAG: DUF433 domain-containing protein [Anaerolineae bacterium]|nr:DUF433 domain-containing protein [Anaerolineae bacterium]
MERTITISEQVYGSLKRQAERNQEPLEALVETWLRQHLDIELYPELEWREGPGGWRVGIKRTAIDVYTVVGYSLAGYSAEEIARELLPRLTLKQVRAALNYYANHPDEIDSILNESETETSKARLCRALGPTDYCKLTGLPGSSSSIDEHN